MTPEQIRIRYESKFIDSEYMLKKRASQQNLTFKELKIYYSEKDYHLDDKTFEANLNLRNQKGEYNLLAELLADRNNIPLIFVKFRGKDQETISERSDYGYRCIITSYDKIKNRLFDNRLEILSHGGLPSGMTKNNFLKESVNQEIKVWRRSF